MVVTLILVSSLDSHSRDRALETLLASRPDAILVRHDLLEGERVLRRVESGSRVVDRAEITLEHGCLSCTVRLDVVPTVLRVLDAFPSPVILGLPPSVHADMVLDILGPELERRGIPVESACLAIDPAALEDQMWDRETLWESGLSSLSSDDRSAGEFLTREISFSDTALLVEGLFAHLAGRNAPRCQSGGAIFLRGIQLLEELGPHLVRSHPDGPLQLGQFGALAAAGRTAPGVINTAVSNHSEGSDAGTLGDDSPPAFSTVVLSAGRPLDPTRLRNALPILATACTWMRGKLWIAGSPEQKIVLGGAGPRIWLEPAGPWGSEAAATRIALTGCEHVPGEFTQLFSDCELTDAEMLAGPKLGTDASGFLA